MFNSISMVSRAIKDMSLLALSVIFCPLVLSVKEEALIDLNSILAVFIVCCIFELDPLSTGINLTLESNPRFNSST